MRFEILTKLTKEQYIWVSLRLGLGWIMLWAFFDKIFGLGFATASENAWIAGGSPTTGFLSYATSGPFNGLFEGMAGVAAVDWIFMIALLLIGVTLVLGIANRIAGYSGAILVLLMWLAVLPPEHNPILDEHVIYAIALVGIAIVRPGKWIGLGEWWSNIKLVKKYPFLE